MKGITLALDVMGGDYGPLVVVPAIKQALHVCTDVNFLLYGKEAQVLPLLQKHDLVRNEAVQFIPTATVISADEDPIKALRHGEKSSMWGAIAAVADKKATGAVSAGSTGALVAIANHLIGTLPVVHRSALVQTLPSYNNSRGTVFLDLGANVRVDAKMLYQYAVMGDILARKLLGIEHPKIALLNIGSEDNKGPHLVQEAHQILKNTELLNYVGFIEGDGLFSGTVDVIVTDGFTGNVALKTAEGLYRVIEHRMHAGVFSTFLYRLGKYILKKRIGLMQPDIYNGSTLLGLDGVVIKSHGSAKSEAFANAIVQAYHEIRLGVPQLIANGLTKL